MNAPKHYSSNSKKSKNFSSIINIIGRIGNRSTEIRKFNTMKHSDKVKFYSFHNYSKSIGTNKKNKTMYPDRDRYRSYMNITGPADYNMPAFWGTINTTTSNYKSSPFYSIGGRCKTPILSKHHTQDMKGKGKRTFA